MSGARVLIVEDEALLAEGIAFNLRHEGFAPERAGTGEEGEALILGPTPPELVLLDVMLPGRDGFQVLERIRQAGSAVPVILLTSRASDADVVRGLELGADDYVQKPFSLAQLVARIRAVLRRARPEPAAPAAPAGSDELLACPGAQVDLRRCLVLRQGSQHPLTPTEVELLRLLARAPGQTLDRLEILRRIWGPMDPSTRTVDNHVARLRKKLEADPAQPRALITVHGKGYRLVLA